MSEQRVFTIVLRPDRNDPRRLISPALVLPGARLLGVVDASSGAFEDVGVEDDAVIIEWDRHPDRLFGEIAIPSDLQRPAALEEAKLGCPILIPPNLFHWTN